MKAGKCILAAGGFVLAAAFGSAAVAQDSGPSGITDPFQGVAVAGTEDLAGASGQMTQSIFVPGVGFAITNTAQGTCTGIEGDDCRATTTSIVEVVGSGDGDVSAGSFSTNSNFSATNILSSQSDTGTSNLGGAANLPNLTAPNLNLTEPNLNLTAPNL